MEYEVGIRMDLLASQMERLEKKVEERLEKKVDQLLEAAGVNTKDGNTN